MIKQLPGVDTDSIQPLSSNCMENVKSSEATLNAWKCGVAQWQEMVKGVIGNVTTALSHVNLTDMLNPRYLFIFSKVKISTWQINTIILSLLGN
jgi:hypothetical protein